MATGRRSFVRWTLGGAVGALMTGAVRRLDAAPRSAGDQWLDAIAGRKHKVFLDIGTFDTAGGPFRRTRALMATLHDTYGVSDKDMGIAFGAHSSGLGFVMTPATWDKLDLITHISRSNLRSAEVAALKTGTRNWGSIAAESVAELQQRGVRFLACKQTMSRWATAIGAQRGIPAATVEAELIAGLHAGVEPVPAMIMAAVVAQERQVSYVSVG